MKPSTFQVRRWSFSCLRRRDFLQLEEFLYPKILKFKFFSFMILEIIIKGLFFKYFWREYFYINFFWIEFIFYFLRIDGFYTRLIDVCMWLPPTHTHTILLLSCVHALARVNLVSKSFFMLERVSIDFWPYRAWPDR